MTPFVEKTTMSREEPRWWNHDKFRWAAVIFEFTLIYSLIVLAHYKGWPTYNHFRFLLLIPMYQAGSAFGYSGGVLMSLLALFVTIPIIPFGDPNSMFHFTPQSNIALLVLYVTFGIVVGGTVGEARSNRRYIENLSGIFTRIFSEPDERAVMIRACEEAEALTNASGSAAIARAAGADPGDWRFVSRYGPGGYEGGGALSPDNILVWCASRNAPLATNSAANDPRLRCGAGAERIRSFAAVPVSFENEAYGAILISDKKNGDNFTGKDLAIVKMIAETSGGAIHNMIQEKNRQEEKVREEQMRELFSRYVSSSVADYVLEHPDLLAGSWREITLLVSDIRDFTAISEKLPARELVAQLNEYFTAMVDVVFDNGGTIDKFIGDCIIAYWGAPAPDAAHAANAIRAAEAMSRALEELNASWAERGTPALDAGIAIHSCTALMGNIGDDRKKAFTILGEEVEKAVKLESLTKTVGAKIIVTEAAARASGADLSPIHGAGESAGRLFTIRAVTA